MLRKISLFITKPGSANQIELIKFLACDSEFNPSATLASAASHQMAKNKVRSNADDGRYEHSPDETIPPRFF